MTDAVPGVVSPLGLVVSLLLVAVAAALAWAMRLGLAPSIVWASARAMVQLLLVGLALQLLLDPDTPIVWAWLWVVGMTIYAAFLVGRRAPEIPGVVPLALVAFAAAAVVTLGVIFGFGVFPLQSRTLVPLAGLMIGNSMTATVVAARQIVAQLRDRREEVEARLALGQSSSQASRPYVAAALRTAMTPNIETTKAVGLVFLPGAMTGLILAGVDPLDAVQVQAVVMFLVLASVAVTTTVVGLGLSRRLFTPDHRLVRLPRSAV